MSLGACSGWKNGGRGLTGAACANSKANASTHNSSIPHIINTPYLLYKTQGLEQTQAEISLICKR